MDSISSRTHSPPPDLAVFVYNLGGGVGRVLTRLVNELSKRHYCIHIVCVRGDDGLLAELHPEIKVHFLKARRVWSTLPGLVKYLRTYTPAVVLSAVDYMNAITLLARRLARGRARVIVSLHISLDKQVAGDSRLRSRVKPMIFGKIYAWSDGIVAVSQASAQTFAELTGYKGNKLTVIYNPVVTATMQIEAQQPVDHKWLQHQTSEVVILAAGRLVQQKDFANLLYAMRIVKEQSADNIKLIILGEGPERASLSALMHQLGLQDCVDFPGHQRNVYAYMAKSSLFVLSSAWEGLPTVLIEAMALGTPVVSTDCPSGPAEILEEGHLGRLVPVGDSKALSKAILDTLSTQVDTDKLQARAGYFSVTRAADLYERVLFPMKTALTSVEDGLGHTESI